MRSSYEYMNYLQVVQVLRRTPRWSKFVRPQQLPEGRWLPGAVTPQLYMAFSNTVTRLMSLVLYAFWIAALVWLIQAL